MTLLFVIQRYNNNRYKKSWYEELFSFFGDIPWMWIFLILFIIWALVKLNKKDFHSHWNTLIPSFKYSTKDFYAELKTELHGHGITGLSTKTTHLKEGGAISYSHSYLQVDWKDYRYFFCCAPYADGIFLSSWLVNKTSLGEMVISRIPFIGNWLARRMFPTTFFTIDSASMFMTYCHNSVLKVADDITKDTGVKIKDTDRKLIMKDIFKR